MIVFFDSFGHLLEIVSEYTLVDGEGGVLASSFSANRGNEGANELLCYFEGLESATAKNSYIQYRKPDISLTPTYPADGEVTGYFEFNPKRDMARFKYGKEYRFVRFALPDPDVLDEPGSYEASVTVSQTEAKALVFDLVCFNVKASAIAPDKDISESQFNVLLNRITLSRQLSDFYERIWDAASDSLSIENASGKGYKVSSGDGFAELSVATLSLASGDWSAFYQPYGIDFSGGGGYFAHLRFSGPNDANKDVTIYFPNAPEDSTLATEEWSKGQFVPLRGDSTVFGSVTVSDSGSATSAKLTPWGVSFTKSSGRSHDNFYFPWISTGGDYELAVKDKASGRLLNVSTPSSATDGASKGYVDDAIAQWRDASMKIVSDLPASGEPGIIYLLTIGGNEYDTYVWENGAWRKIGSSSVDLSDYYTKEQVDSLLPGQSGAPVWPAKVSSDGSVSVSFDPDLARQPKKGDYCFVSSIQPGYEGSLECGGIYLIATASAQLGTATVTLSGSALGNVRGPKGTDGVNVWAGELVRVHAGSVMVNAVSIGKHPEATTADSVVITSINALAEPTADPYKAGDVCKVSQVQTLNGEDYYLVPGSVIGNIVGPQGAQGPKGDKGDKGDTGDQGPQGDTGPAGESATISSVTASVDGTSGTPSVSAELGGSPTDRTISFAFTGLKGAKGDRGDVGPQGVGITSITIEGA